MSKGNTSRRLRAEDFRVDTSLRPGWVLGSHRMLVAGTEVLCTGGVGVVTAVRGKTSDGSQLLEIQLTDSAAKPFYAAASNVLVAPQ